MSTASTLGQYRRELEAEGFTREEALDLVGYAAPTELADLDTTPVRAPRTLPPGALRIVVLAGSHDEARRWKNDQFTRNGIDHLDRFIITAGDVRLLAGLPAPLATMALPGFYRLPAEKRAEIEDTIQRINAAL
ncbi:hypothetical protein GCM10027294_53010 [Marinactinospora endophytica]